MLTSKNSNTTSHNMIGKVCLKAMTFHAFHGCYEKERLHGNTFIVHINFWYNVEKAALSDNLEDSVDYTKVYDRVNVIMQEPVNLLEHLANKILLDLQNNFKEVKRWQIKVEKCSPPIEGKIESIGIEIESE